MLWFLMDCLVGLDELEKPFGRTFGLLCSRAHGIFDEGLSSTCRRGGHGQSGARGAWRVRVVARACEGLWRKGWCRRMSP